MNRIMLENEPWPLENRSKNWMWKLPLPWGEGEGRVRSSQLVAYGNHFSVLLLKSLDGMHSCIRFLISAVTIGMLTLIMGVPVAHAQNFPGDMALSLGLIDGEDWQKGAEG